MLVEQLAAALPQLPVTDHNFAKSLITGHKRFKSFTPRQEIFVKRLIAKAQTQTVDGDRQKIALGNFETLISMFVGTKLKSPVVHLLAGEVEIVLKLAGGRVGSKARHPGTIDVSTVGGFDAATWYGRILKTGEFEVSPRDQPSASIISMLHAFAAEPHKVAREFGYKTGRCCFCNIKLTDPKSVSNGFGPICGKRYTSYLIAG